MTVKVRHFSVLSAHLGCLLLAVMHAFLILPPCCFIDLFADFQVAVYKTEDGEVQCFGGLCPHLGCLLLAAMNNPFQSCQLDIV
jgi:hypothetical protein